MSHSEPPRIVAIGSGGLLGPGEFDPEGELEGDESVIHPTFTGSGHDTPEEAALASYPPGEARVLGVEVDGDEATVDIEVNPNGYAVWEHCLREDGRWFDAGHSG
jgi:hypothetical protein